MNAQAVGLARVQESDGTIEILIVWFFFFFSSRRRHTRFDCDWSSDVCSSDLRVRERQERVEGVARIDAHREARAEGPLAALLSVVGLRLVAPERPVFLPRVRDEIGRASCRERV